MIRPYLITVIKLFLLTNLINSSYIFDALHNSDDKYYQASILNITNVERRYVYNDDFQKNITEIYVKGI
jgi:hypothetical protein